MTDKHQKQTPNPISYLAIDEVSHLLRSKDNLIYLFQLNGILTRIHFASKKNDLDDVLEGCDKWQKKSFEDI